MSVCVGEERDGDRDRKNAEERKEEQGERGRWGKREKCGGSMSASDKGISLPPVGQSERLTLQAHTQRCTHTCLCGRQLCCLGLVNK